MPRRQTKRGDAEVRVEREKSGTPEYGQAFNLRLQQQVVIVDVRGLVEFWRCERVLKKRAESDTPPATAVKWGAKARWHAAVAQLSIQSAVEGQRARGGGGGRGRGAVGCVRATFMSWKMTFLNETEGRP
eukprot:6174034-Pleurochrysis_carterae.AAC.2